MGKCSHKAFRRCCEVKAPYGPKRNGLSERGSETKFETASRENRAERRRSRYISTSEWNDLKVSNREKREGKRPLSTYNSI
ncbi:Hypothetical protein NTJ_01013 [Nesidiocoris tenuis]|uniref:Uncharacterized protein n=1 Tax=Nesidiocoris tenuis TaxID=355587 RepID=A0ABN7AD78_9HEMI|nr:Hypothetical protein NTJ_01013 [Nesidiocoris tenuis]